MLVAAFLGQFIRRQMLERHYQHFFTWIVCGVAASGTYMGIVTALDAAGAVTGNHQGGIISAILFLIPGFPMVTAMLDLFRQDFSSALSRGAYVLMVMAAAGIAVWTVTFIFRWDVESASGVPLDGPLLYVLRCFCSFIAAYGFAMLFNAGTKASTLAAVVGALANTGRLLLIDVFHVPWQLAVGLAAVTIGLLAQLFVSRASLSRVALSVPAVVIMIPGVPFYRAISALNTLSIDKGVDVGDAATNLFEVFFVITAIGVGLALARSSPTTTGVTMSPPLDTSRSLALRPRRLHSRRRTDPPGLLRASRIMVVRRSSQRRTTMCSTGRARRGGGT